jgi:hypothetical protein
MSQLQISGHAWFLSILILATEPSVRIPTWQHVWCVVEGGAPLPLADRPPLVGRIEVLRIEEGRAGVEERRARSPSPRPPHRRVVGIHRGRPCNRSVERLH